MKKQSLDEEYKTWSHDFAEWIQKPSFKKQKLNDNEYREFKDFMDEYLKKYKGISDFFDSYFSAHARYHEAVNNSDKQTRKTILEESLKYAETSKHLDEQKGGFHIEQLGIDNLIDVIKKELDELNINTSNSQNQNP